MPTVWAVISGGLPDERRGNAEPEPSAGSRKAFFPNAIGSVLRAAATYTNAMLRLLGARPVEPRLVAQEPLPARKSDPLVALVARAVCRDPRAEQTLLVTVGPAVLGVVRRVLGARHPEVEDVCQEACLGLLSALPSFRAECTVMHFACRVALLTALAARRRRDRNIAFLPEVDEEPDECVAGAASPAEVFESARRRIALRSLIDELPLAQAEVLALHVILGHTVGETSQMTGVAVNTVRSRLRRGLAALRDRLFSNQKLRELVEGHHEQG